MRAAHSSARVDAATNQGSLARPDSTETLRSARVPALVLAGEEDRLTPPEVARDLVGLMPRSELVVLPRCGHLAPVEAPEVFAAAVLDWLPRALG